jgi:hypothetical protein
MRNALVSFNFKSLNSDFLVKLTDFKKLLRFRP